MNKITFLRWPQEQHSLENHNLSSGTPRLTSCLTNLQSILNAHGWNTLYINSTFLYYHTTCAVGLHVGLLWSELKLNVIYNIYLLLILNVVSCRLKKCKYCSFFQQNYTLWPIWHFTVNLSFTQLKFILPGWKKAISGSESENESRIWSPKKCRDEALKIWNKCIRMIGQINYL